MSAKENFGKAMFDMFGVGAGVDSAESQDEALVEAVAEDVVATVAEEAVVEKKAVAYAVPKPAVSQTYLAADTVLEGTLRTKSDVTIAGTFKGDIFADGDVTLHTSVTGNVAARNMTLMGCSLHGECTTTETVSIRESSSLQGNINAKDLLCSGTVDGDIVVSHNVKLEATARIKGNITAASLSVERGAIIEGKLIIG